MERAVPPPVPVLAPALPPDVARVLRDGPEALRLARSGVRPPPPGPSPAILMIVSLFLLLGLIFTGPWGMFAMGAALVCVGGVQALAADPGARAARRRLRVAARHADRFVLPSDLDAGGRELLARAQAAVGEVLGSRINRDRLLDDIDNAVTLPAELWHLGVRLAELARAGAEHERIVPKDLPGDIAEVFEPYDRALDLARRALAARVEVLEAYAREVRRADAVYRAYRQLGVLRERTGEYQRLVAQSAVEQPAAAPIGRLGEQAGEIERVFRRSIDEARKAGGHLLSLTA
ncbi:hypothetical protein ABGB17_27120 [Sphaerisporangium sp. B11E5]|uniref:hypothetical protein n=1 Tax=Sphaerisporangium sp. B11E5 TaxID=3153563 RepID=UPI00325F6D39